MGATLKELADAAGVSTATASRAFSRPELVGEQTRARILELAARLNYVPNQAAQALSTGRTGTFGLVVPDLNNPFYTGIIKGAQRQAHRGGQALLIADTEEQPEAELALAQRVAQRTDALILCSPRMAPEQLEVLSRVHPLVLINRAHDALPSVGIDATAGVCAAVRHLRALGHERIGYVGGPAHSYSNADREAQLRVHAEASGLEVVWLGSFDPTFEGGRAAADQVLVAKVGAVLVYNDVMAIGLVGRLLAYGIAVPGGVSVIGWDDIEFAEMLTPPLTTVHVPREEVGRAAVSYLTAVIDGRSSEPPRLATTLAFRQTTGRPGVPAPAAASALRRPTEALAPQREKETWSD